MDREAREKAGLTDGLIRLSIGIEALEDLREDLRRGLARVAAVVQQPAFSRAAAAC
jgi:cystathionine gamma-synthase